MEEKIKHEVRSGAVAAAVSYVFFICIFVLLYKKNAFSRYHAKQGLVLFLGLIICWALAVVLHTGFISGVANILYLICAVTGVFSSLMGKRVKFPVVSEVANKLVV